MERASRGDCDAFAALAAASVDGCYALAFRILRDVHRAQDATQQALLGGWRDLPTLKEPDRFEAWLHRLVVHACYAEARRDRRWTARIRLISTDMPTAPDTARQFPTATPLPDGRVLVAGGSTKGGTHPVASAELCDPGSP